MPQNQLQYRQSDSKRSLGSSQNFKDKICLKSKQRESSQNHNARQNIDFYPQAAKQSEYEKDQRRSRSNNLDQTCSSKSSTSSDEKTIDDNIQSLITQVKKQDSLKYSTSTLTQQPPSNPVIYDSSLQPKHQATSQSTHQLRSSHNQFSSPVKQEMALLLRQKERDRGKKTLVLDLDETLVHSSFKPIDNPDIILPVEIDGKTQMVYVLKRPHCEEFIARMSIHYEVVMFTASLSKYAEPLYAQLDHELVTAKNLYREHCTFYNGLFVKDMARLGRSLSDVIIIDNSPNSYLFQPENSLPSINWYEDKNDRELMDMVPILEKLAFVNDVREFLPKIVDDNKINFLKAKEVLNYGKLIIPEDEDRKMFTPLKYREEDHEGRRYNSNQKSNHQQQLLTNSHSVALLSSHLQHTPSQSQNTQNVERRTTTSRPQLSQSVPRNNDQQQNSQVSSVQYSIDQFKRQQQISNKQQEQIDEIKKRVLTCTQQPQIQNQQSPKQSQVEDKQYFNSSISQSELRKKQSTSSLQSSYKGDKENKGQSYSIQDKKYQEYLMSLQSHQKRSSSLQSGTDRKRKTTTQQSEREKLSKNINTQKTTDSNLGQKQVPKRVASATTRPSSQPTLQMKPQYLDSSQSSYSLSQKASDSFKTTKYSSVSSSQKLAVFNFQSTPNKSSINRITHSTFHTPKGTQGIQNSLSKSNLTSNSAQKRESSFSALQQKTQDLKKNFANFIKSIEGTNAVVGSQTTQNQKSSSFKLQEQQNRPSTMNKFIAKFEQLNKHTDHNFQTSNNSNTQPNHSLKVISQTPQSVKQHSKDHQSQNNQQQQQLQQQQEANKNHLSYSTIYQKLSQQNLNFSMSPTSHYANMQAAQSNVPVKPSHCQGQQSSGMQSMGQQMSSYRGTANTSSSQSLNSPTVNLIALQMLKNASSPHSKQH